MRSLGVASSTTLFLLSCGLAVASSSGGVGGGEGAGGEMGGGDQTVTLDAQHPDWQDGNKQVHFDGDDKSAPVTLHVWHREDGRIKKVHVYVPVKAKAKISRLNGNDPSDPGDNDAITVNGGEAVLENVNQNEVDISEGGKAGCDDCDSNLIDFGKGGGTLSGKDSDNNTVLTHGQLNVNVRNFHGNGNVFP